VNNIYEKAEAARWFIQQSIPDIQLDACIISGTGLGEIWKEMIVLKEIPYSSIPHFMRNTVQSHKGIIYICTFNGKHIAILSGRFHYYEGYNAQEVSFPIRVMKALGIPKTLITNVAGGLNPSYKAGDIVLIRDHINIQPGHPLRGFNDNRLGVRFPDMLKTYDTVSIEKLKAYAQSKSISAHQGVYLALQGPSLETPAEYEYLHRIGADLVGMSTVPEVITAVHSSMKVTAISVVSNVCYPIDKISETTVEEVIAVAKATIPSLSKLILKWID
jgi:purine-nucleoside phosphorylase